MSTSISLSIPTVLPLVRLFLCKESLEMQESVYTAEVYTAKITSLHLKRFLLEKKIVQYWKFT